MLRFLLDLIYISRLRDGWDGCVARAPLPEEVRYVRTAVWRTCQHDVPWPKVSVKPVTGMILLEWSTDKIYLSHAYDFDNMQIWECYLNFDDDLPLDDPKRNWNPYSIGYLKVDETTSFFGYARHVLERLQLKGNAS